MLTNLSILVMSIIMSYGFVDNFIFLSDPVAGTLKSWCSHDTRVTYAVLCSSFFLGKTLMYCVFIMRLHSVYSRCAFGYKPAVLTTLASVICVVMVSLATLQNLTMELQPFEFTLFGENVRHCNYKPAMLASFSYGIFELTLAVTMIVLFVSPLKKLLKLLENRQSGDRTRSKMGFEKAAVKVTTLVLMAVSTSVGAIAISAVTKTGVPWFVVDASINILCILLMTPYYTNVYKKLCCCCINGCIMCCLRKHQKTVQQIRTARSGTNTSPVCPDS